MHARKYALSEVASNGCIETFTPENRLRKFKMLTFVAEKKHLTLSRHMEGGCCRVEKKKLIRIDEQLKILI